MIQSIKITTKSFVFDNFAFVIEDFLGQYDESMHHL